MLTILRGYTIAVLENAESGDAVTRDLVQVFEITSRTTSLAQAMTDEMVPQNARRAVAHELFATRIVPPALRIAERAIVTERADNLLTALNELADLALQYVDLGPEQFEAEERLFGRVGARHLTSGYATAVLEDVASVSELEEIEDELFRFARTVDSSEGLRRALADSSRPIGDRRNLVSELLEGKVNSVTVRLARSAMLSRSRDPSGALDWMAERVAEARGWRVARVSTARELDASERTDLARAVEELTHNPVELLVTEDARLLGGAVIAVGNLLVDASVQHRLEQLYEQVLGSDHVALEMN